MMNILQSQESLRDGIFRNQDSILSALRIFVDMLGNLSNLSDIIYTPNATYPIEIYKTFRMLYENTESISNILQNYQSQNQEFLQQKDQLVAEQIHRMEQIINRQQAQNDNEYRYPKRQSKNYQNRNGEDSNSIVLNLQREIATLNQVLQRNNYQFQEQIKRYNNHLYELKEALQRYEIQLERVQQLQVFVEQLQNKIVLLRQEKQRDSLMIENMARKIRFFEKEKGGRQAFLSPRAPSNVQNHLYSPISKPFTLGRTQMNSYRKYQQ